MHILFIDHASHAKTKSADFFIRLLEASKHIVRITRYEKHYECNIPHEDIEWADAIVIWEFLPSRFTLAYPGKPCIFVPMYDNEWGSRWQWKRIAAANIGVISFCDKISAHAATCGVKNILTVHYFPDPAIFPQSRGDDNRVFLWERGEIGCDDAKKIFPDGYKFDIKKSEEFLAREEYLERISKAGIFVAPRRKEGIGMTFLEAMAMGKCVVAHNDATMNEYIANGKNGILVDVRKPQRIDRAVVELVRSGAASAASRLHSRWRHDKEGIAPFIEKCSQSCVVKTPWSARSILYYICYLLEGATMKIKEKCRGL